MAFVIYVLTMVKRDALQAITSCISNYGPGAANLYSITLWDALKFEILNAQEEDLAEEALRSLTEIATQLTLSAHDDPLQNYLQPITKECNEHLEDTPTKQSAAAGQVLEAVSTASPDACNLVAKKVLPHWLALYSSSENLPRRRGLLECLEVLLNAHAKTFGRWRERTSTPMDAQRSKAAPTAAIEHVPALIDCLRVALLRTPVSEVSFRLLALSCLKKAVVTRRLLDDGTITSVIRACNHVIIDEEPYGKDEVKALAIDCLVDIAHQKSQLIIERALPEFVAQLPDTDVDYLKHYVPALETLAKLSSEPQIFKTIILRLRNRYTTAIRNQSSSRYVSALLAAILYAFSHGAAELSDPSNASSYYTDFVIPSISEIASEDAPDALRDPLVLEHVGRICNIILRQQPFAAQTEICRNVYTLFRQKEITQVPPFVLTRTSSASTLILSTHLIAALQREARPHTDMVGLLDALVSFASRDDISAPVRATLIVQISLIVNKFFKASDPALISTTNKLIDDPNASSKSLLVAFTILKALTLRNSPLLKSLVPRFLARLSGRLHSLQVASSFSTILAPSEVLVPENHCIVYALHKQRFFSLTVPWMAETFRNHPESVSSDHDKRQSSRYSILIALSGILYYIPYDLLKEQLATLVPLLLQSLSIEDNDVTARTISTFEKVVREDPKLIDDHIGSLTSRLCDIACVSSPPPMNSSKKPGVSPITLHPPKTRAAALACLATFPGSFRTDQLIPHRNTVARRLLAPLDDKKRAVRAEAVRCRRMWLGIGGEEEAE